MVLYDERGQGTVEYVLVILAAAAMAVALIAFVTSSDLVPRFFSTVMQKVIGYAGGAITGRLRSSSHWSFRSFCCCYSCWWK